MAALLPQDILETFRDKSTPGPRGKEVTKAAFDTGMQASTHLCSCAWALGLVPSKFVAGSSALEAGQIYCARGRREAEGSGTSCCVRGSVMVMVGVVLMGMGMGMGVGVV